MNESTDTLNYRTFSTATDTWGPNEVVESGIGIDFDGNTQYRRETTNSLVVDVNEVPHVVYKSGSSLVHRYLDRRHLEPAVRHRHAAGRHSAPLVAGRRRPGESPRHLAPQRLDGRHESSPADHVPPSRPGRRVEPRRGRLRDGRADERELRPGAEHRGHSERRAAHRLCQRAARERRQDSPPVGGDLGDEPSAGRRLHARPAGVLAVQRRLRLPRPRPGDPLRLRLPAGQSAVGAVRPARQQRGQRRVRIASLGPAPRDEPRRDRRDLLRGEPRERLAPASRALLHGGPSERWDRPTRRRRPRRTGSSRRPRRRTRSRSRGARPRTTQA